MKRIYFFFLLIVSISGYSQDVIEPIPISYEHFKDSSILVSVPFNVDESFYRLFPGSYTKQIGWPNEKDTARISIWSSHDFPPLKINSNYETTTFPFNINDTRLLTPIFFSMKGEGDFICLPTTTSLYDVSLALSGRFSCGVLGLGLFKKEIRNWKLIRFNPAITCLGAYSTAPQPKLLKLNKENFLFVVENWNGAAGNFYRGDIYFIGLVKNSFQIISTIPHCKHGNDTNVEWNYEIKSSSNYIIITWVGNFSKEKILQEYNLSKIEDTDLPKQLKETAFRKSIFKFKLIQKYKFYQGNLTFVEEKINVF